MRAKILSTKEKPKTGSYKTYIAFVPGQGFQQALYYNGSDTWFSVVTKSEIKPTHYFYPFFDWDDDIKPQQCNEIFVADKVAAHNFYNEIIGKIDLEIEKSKIQNDTKP